MAERAEKRAAVKNLDTPAAAQGMLSSPFAVLQDLPDTHLESVLHDVGLAFSQEVGTAKEAISLVRAKELAQASLAEAAFRKDLAAKLAAVHDSSALTSIMGVEGGESETGTTQLGLPGKQPSSFTPVPPLRGTRAGGTGSRRGRRKTGAA